MLDKEAAQAAIAVQERMQVDKAEGGASGLDQHVGQSNPRRQVFKDGVDDFQIDALVAQRKFQMAYQCVFDSPPLRKRFRRKIITLISI